MTSLEIAGVVESRHDDVKRSIKRLAERGVIVQPPMADEQSIDSMGRTRTTEVYCIGERDSYVIVAQLSPEFTAKQVPILSIRKTRSHVHHMVQRHSSTVSIQM